MMTFNEENYNIINQLRWELSGHNQLCPGVFMALEFSYCAKDM